MGPEYDRDGEISNPLPICYLKIDRKFLTQNLKKHLINSIVRFVQTFFFFSLILILKKCKKIYKDNLLYFSHLTSCWRDIWKNTFSKLAANIFFLPTLPSFCAPSTLPKLDFPIAKNCYWLHKLYVYIYFNSSGLSFSVSVCAEWTKKQFRCNTWACKIVTSYACIVLQNGKFYMLVYGPL